MKHDLPQSTLHGLANASATAYAWPKQELVERIRSAAHGKSACDWLTAVRCAKRNGILTEGTDHYYFTERFDALDTKRIAQALRHSRHAERWNYLQSTDSTNKQLRHSNCTFCITDWQHAGYGRRGQQWHAPFGCNLLFSMRWQEPITPADNHPTYALQAAMAATNTLQARYPNLCFQIKWPNDILLNGKKCAGLLLERLMHKRTCTYLLGLGLNINASRTLTSTQHSIYHATGQYQPREPILLDLLQALTTNHLDCMHGKTFCPSSYQRLHALHQKNIVFQSHMIDIANQAQSNIRKGYVTGVNDHGHLQIVDNGSMHTFNNQDIHSLRVVAG